MGQYGESVENHKIWTKMGYEKEKAEVKYYL